MRLVSALLILLAAQVAIAAPTSRACVAQAAGQAVGGAGPAFRDCADAPVMVDIPAGSFVMGDALGGGSVYERPAHEVRMPRFAIGRSEVTQEQWSACVDAGACAPPAVHSEGRNRPVTHISWRQARAYTAWLSARTGARYHLPSEAEWEYAARAGHDWKYSWGNNAAVACQYANVFDHAGRLLRAEWTWNADCSDGYAGTAPVMRFPPNSWGLYDMLGNVWEWVEDCWNSDYTGAPGDGSARLEGDCTKRVNRGGGWGNSPTTLRLSARDADPADAYSEGLGFRVARDLPQLPAAAQTAARTASPTQPRECTQQNGCITPSSRPAPPQPQARVAPAPRYREFRLDVRVEAEQSWRNGLQWSKAGSQQHYRIVTQLRSDGRLYTRNLLDPDLRERTRIKTEYYTYQGLLEIQREFGGRLPSAAELPAGDDGMRTLTGSPERFAAIAAIQDNSGEELEAFLRSFDHAPNGRWLYYLGYPDCPSRVEVEYRMHIAGEQAFDRDQRDPRPFAVDRAADSAVPGEVDKLCRRYVITVDTVTGEMHLENVYFPEAAGTSTRTGARAEQRDARFTPPNEVMEWANRLLRKGPQQGRDEVTLPITLPLDGNATVLGAFKGTAKVSLEWSLK